MKLGTVYAAVLILSLQTTLSNTQQTTLEADLESTTPEIDQTTLTQTTPEVYPESITSDIDPEYTTSDIDPEYTTPDIDPATLTPEDEEPTYNLNANGTIELGLTEVPVNRTVNGTNVGIDSQDGTADSLADYLIQKVGETLTGSKDPDGDTDTQEGAVIIENSDGDGAVIIENTDGDTLDGEFAEEINNITITDLEEEIQKEKDECNTPATLDRYNCTLIPAAVRDYFGGDMTAKSMLNQLFRSDVMEQLRNCTPGSWCAPYETHVEIKLSLSVFYKHGPFCSDAMRCSLNTMLEKRYICEEQDLVFLANAVELMCDLKLAEDVDENYKCDDVDECYTRTKEALYTLYQDVITPNQEHKNALYAADCNSYRVEVAKSYLCADKCCQFDQQELLQRFELWDGLSDTAGDITSLCNITDSCEVNRRDMTEDVYEYFTDNDDWNTTENYDENYYTTDKVDLEEEEEKAAKLLDEEIEAVNNMVDELKGATGEPVGETNDDMYTDFGDFAGMGMAESDTTDSTMVFGVVVAAGLIVLTLIFIIFIGYRRFRSRSFGFTGYSKLNDEETRIFGHEYN